MSLRAAAIPPNLPLFLLLLPVQSLLVMSLGFLWSIELKIDLSPLIIPPSKLESWA